MDQSAPTERTTVKRHADRAVYDRETIAAILDEALFCHVAVVTDGSPRVIPTIHARVGDTLYIHGSNASRTLKALKDGSEVCVAVTLLDGLILARSAFNHSMNYRSVMVYGSVREVTDPDEKWEAQRALVEHIVPGRSADVRMPNEKELRQTTILAISLEEASAKVRSGPSKDTEDDYNLPVWAGEIPLRLVPQPPVDDPRLIGDIAPPDYARDYRRGE
jgi:nitroimidazol reductase NimA-like FMN-containing flavoprotein (pyridoxamine 5'-phosphate oxidase superfamily)